MSSESNVDHSTIPLPQASLSQLNAEHLETVRKLAQRDHEVLTAQQRAKEAERAAAGEWHVRLVDC